MILCRYLPSSSSLGEEEMMERPSDLDICCGRGKGRWNSPGNRRFKELVLQYLNEYQLAPSKTAKSKVVESVVKEVQARGGRFLRRDETQGLWVEIGAAARRAKVAHCIRDHLATSKKRRSLESGEDITSPGRQSRSPKHSKQASAAHERGVLGSRRSQETRALLNHHQNFASSAAFMQQLTGAGLNQSHELRSDALLPFMPSHHAAALQAMGLQTNSANIVNPLRTHTLPQANDFQMVPFPISSASTLQMNGLTGNPALQGLRGHDSLRGNDLLGPSNQQHRGATNLSALTGHLSRSLQPGEEDIPSGDPSSLSMNVPQQIVSATPAGLPGLSSSGMTSRRHSGSDVSSTAGDLGALASQLDPEQVGFILSLEYERNKE